MEAQIEITEDIAIKVLETVDAGLSNGLGNQKPGEMCVEAAVRYALGMDHGGDPKWVSSAIRKLKIRLNDSRWSSKEARAKGMRRLAVAQLGSAGCFDDKEFTRRVAKLAISKMVPIALRAAAKIHPDSNHKAKLLTAADKCERSKDRKSAIEAGIIAAAAAADAYLADAYLAAAYADAAADADDAADAAADAAAAYAYAYAVDAAVGRDKILSDFAEDVVQILINMKAPGCQWLPLTEINQ